MFCVKRESRRDSLFTQRHKCPCWAIEKRDKVSPVKETENRPLSPERRVMSGHDAIFEGRADAWSIRRITHATGMLRPLRVTLGAPAIGAGNEPSGQACLPIRRMPRLERSERARAGPRKSISGIGHSAEDILCDGNRANDYLTVTLSRNLMKFPSEYDIIILTPTEKEART